jgi:hypothetical protein
MYWFYYDRTPPRLASAKSAIDAALRLAPAPRGPCRSGLLLLGPPGSPACPGGVRARDRAAAEQQRPAGGDRVRGTAPWELGSGRRANERGAALRPAVRASHAGPRRHLHVGPQVPESERLFDRAIQLAPDWAEPYAYKAMLHLVWRGDLTLARAVIGRALTRVNAGRLAQALLIPDAISAALPTSDSLRAASLEAVTPASFRRRYCALPPAARGGRALSEPPRSRAGARRFRERVSAARDRRSARRCQAAGAGRNRPCARGAEAGGDRGWTAGRGPSATRHQKKTPIPDLLC